MHVLVLGFSVLNGLVAEFSKTHDGDSFTTRVLGGNHFELLPYIIDGILSKDKPDLVILDLVSTPRVPRWTEELFLDATNFLVARCQAAGARVAFANLFRSDVIQASDILHNSIRDIAERIGAPILDMLALHMRQGHDLAGLYPDGNHPSASGRAILVASLLDLAHSTSEQRSPDDLPINYLNAMPTSFGFPAGLVGFERYGFDTPVRSLPEGVLQTIDLPEGFQIRGLLAVMGPRTGDLSIKYGDVARSEPLYDKFCYYARLKHVHLLPRTVAQLFLEQSIKLPTMALAKGEPDLSPRLGAIAAILGTMKSGFSAPVSSY